MNNPYIGQFGMKGNKIVGGVDIDYLPGISIKGGARSPVNNAWIGVTDTGKKGGDGKKPDKDVAGGHDEVQSFDQQNSWANTPYGGYGAGGGAYRPAADPTRISQYDQSIDVLQNAMNRLGGQFEIAKNNIGDMFNTNRNELDSSKTRAEKSYGDSSTTNQQQFRGNKNTITDQAAQSLQGAMRLLGMYGAGGSSERDLVGDAVASQATAQNSGAGQNYATNQRNLDTNIFDFREEDKNQRKKLEDWRTQSVNQAEQQRLTQQQDLQTKLAALRGERASYTGGNYAGAAAADINAAKALSSRIDELGRFSPTYTGKTPVYNQAALSSYQTGNGANISSNAGNPAAGPAQPWLQALLNDDKEKGLL